MIVFYTKMAQDNRGKINSLLSLLGVRNARPTLLCAVCGREKALPHGLCPRCAASLSPASVTADQLAGLDGLCAAFAYDRVARRCIDAFKYRGRRELTEFFAPPMAACDLFEPDCVLIPVPLHPRRRRQRGFSQTELLVRQLSDLTGRPVLRRALERTRNTHSQSTLHGKERLTNLDDAFEAFGVRGLRVILVDDVVGTGTTLRRCAEALKAAGAQRVYGLTAAAAMPRQEA